VCVCVHFFLWNGLAFILSGGSVLYRRFGVWPFSWLGGGGVMAGGSLKGVKDCVWECGMVVI
jgi:hypothetical protein